MKKSILLIIGVSLMVTTAVQPSWPIQVGWRIFAETMWIAYKVSGDEINAGIIHQPGLRDNSTEP